MIGLVLEARSLRVACHAGMKPKSIALTTASPTVVSTTIASAPSIETPTRMSAKQKKLLEEFRATETGDECPAAKSFFARARDYFA